MTEQDQAVKTRAAVKGILGLLRRPASRTQLVKLVYLADNKFYESLGRTITGGQYIWDACAPKSEGDAIAAAAERLADDGEIRRARIQPGDDPEDSAACEYWADDPTEAWRSTDPALNDGERQILMGIVRKYGRYNAADLAELSKETPPFKNAAQYDRLQFVQSARAIEIQKMIAADPDFIAEVMKGLEDEKAGRWVWDDELEVR